ncbi:MAG: DUF4956 domain-containing protein [Mycoplasmatota bacterium]|nr:DUF4956 domain-containing protein [Mycoplasmatota bacterium]
MLKSLFSNTTSSIELSSILICTLVALLLGLIIAHTHKRTTRYSKDFLITLAILPVLIQTIMIMVNGNLGTSVAILGAFSLVRFRSIPGTSKEILSVIFSMTIGLATGMGHVLFATIMTLIISLAIIIFSKIDIFSLNREEKLLKIVIPENMDYTTMFDEIFAKYTKETHLDHVKTTNMGSLFELTYRIILNKGINEKEFIDDLRIRNGNLKVMLSHEIKGTDI